MHSGATSFEVNFFVPLPMFSAEFDEGVAPCPLLVTAMIIINALNVQLLKMLPESLQNGFHKAISDRNLSGFMITFVIHQEYFKE